MLNALVYSDVLKGCTTYLAGLIKTSAAVSSTWISSRIIVSRGGKSSEKSDTESNFNKGDNDDGTNDATNP